MVTSRESASGQGSTDVPGAGTFRLTVGETILPLFFPFLQKGVTVPARACCSIKAFLCEQLGLEPSYVEERVQTCFLNGKAVDDMETATIQTGSTLSLSGALPGLLGATLRKGSFYASMRQQISHNECNGKQGPEDGVVRMKLFNLVLKELGPALLQRGVQVEGAELEDFFKRQGNLFWESCEEISINGEKIEKDRLDSIGYGSGAVFLQVSVGG